MASEYSSTTTELQKTMSAALGSANNNASRIYSLPQPANLRDPNFNVKLTKPVLEPPPKFSDLFGTGDNTNATVDWLNEEFDAWMAKYFPELNGCLKNQPEELMCNIFSGVKPFGIDSTVFELVWHQARDRARRTVDSSRATLAADFSSRGFSLPPGAMVAALTAAEAAGISDVLDVNRDQAMKDAEIKIDILKHAMSLAVQLKLGVMAAAADFYRLWATLPDKDIERARVKAAALSGFYSALSSYYNVELGFQELTLKAATADAEVDISVDRNKVAVQGNQASISGALGSAVSAFADTAGRAAIAGGSLTAQIESL